MAVDTSLMNIIPTKLKRVGKEYHGPCPYCGGNDRFYLKADNTFGCRRCGSSGDAITILMQWGGMGYFDACERLGIEPDEKYKKGKGKRGSKNLDLSKVPVTNTNIAPAPDSVPALDNPEYQERIAAFVNWSWENLHSGNYHQIARYLGDRGFAEYHTDIWMIGYNPQKFNLVWGGIEVYLPKGIVIPYLDEHDNIYKVKVRRENANSKYLPIAGGANWLFNSHRIRPDSIVVMVESEIDAISVAIGWNHHKIVPVATGATTGARWLRWPALLATAQKVLVAYDSDEAGENAAKWWLDVLPNSKRLIPLAHDVNDMLVKGISIPDWIKSALNIRQEQETSSTKQQSFLENSPTAKNHYQYET